MSENELLKYCHYYSGGIKSPSQNRVFSALWQAEQMACTDLADTISETNTKDDFDKVVFAFISKWYPYEYKSILDDYIKNANPSQAIIKVYYN